MAFLGVLFLTCYCHDIAWSSRTNILQLMRLSCCLWIISGSYCDHFHVGIWYYFGVLHWTCAFGFLVATMIIFMIVSGIILEYYFGCHAAFGLLVVRMIIFMMLVDVLLLLLGVLISERMFTCGS